MERRLCTNDGAEGLHSYSSTGLPLITPGGPPLRSALEEHVTVYAIDRRGRGESGDTTEYALEREAADVAAVVDSIDESVILLGHSYGGLCSLKAALRTDNLSKLILYEPPLPVSDHDPDTADVLDEMTALLDDGENEQALVRFFRGIVGSTPTELDAYRSAPDWPARVNAVHTVIREERARKGYEFYVARFDGLVTPTLLLAGSESHPFLRDSTDVLADTLPNGQMTILDGHGHAAMTTAPERFTDEVLAFINESS